MLTIEDVKCYKADTKLETEVKDILISNMQAAYVEEFFEDLLQNGCASGIVSEMIYYYDTTKFYERHKEEINKMLKELKAETGFDCLGDLFKDFDNEDPLILEQNNQNILAWYAFEETAQKIYHSLKR